VQIVHTVTSMTEKVSENSPDPGSQVRCIVPGLARARRRAACINTYKPVGGAWNLCTRVCRSHIDSRHQAVARNALNPIDPHRRRRHPTRARARATGQAPQPWASAGPPPLIADRHRRCRFHSSAQMRRRRCTGSCPTSIVHMMPFLSNETSP
jgi:hypothetical protein